MTKRYNDEWHVGNLIPWGMDTQFCLFPMASFDSIRSKFKTTKCVENLFTKLSFVKLSRPFFMFISRSFPQKLGLWVRWSKRNCTSVYLPKSHFNLMKTCRFKHVFPPTMTNILCRSSLLVLGITRVWSWTPGIQIYWKHCQLWEPLNNFVRRNADRVSPNIEAFLLIRFEYSTIKRAHGFTVL